MLCVRLFVVAAVSTCAWAIGEDVYHYVLGPPHRDSCNVICEHEGGVCANKEAPLDLSIKANALEVIVNLTSIDPAKCVSLRSEDSTMATIVPAFHDAKAVQLCWWSPNWARDTWSCDVAAYTKAFQQVCYCRASSTPATSTSSSTTKTSSDASTSSTTRTSSTATTSSTTRTSSDASTSSATRTSSTATTSSATRTSSGATTSSTARTSSTATTSSTTRTSSTATTRASTTTTIASTTSTTTSTMSTSITTSATISTSNGIVTSVPASPTTTGADRCQDWSSGAPSTSANYTVTEAGSKDLCCQRCAVDSACQHVVFGHNSSLFGVCLLYPKGDAPSVLAALIGAAFQVPDCPEDLLDCQFASLTLPQQQSKLSTGVLVSGFTVSGIFAVIIGFLLGRCVVRLLFGKKLQLQPEHSESFVSSRA